MSYLYRREDNDEIVEVDFATAMEQRDGFITLPDGVLAKRCVHLEQQNCPTVGQLTRDKVQAEIISDGMGFTAHCLPDMQKHLAETGIKGVEFVPDPHPETNFYRVKCSSWKAWRAYLKSRGLVDRNSRNGGGQSLSSDLLKRTAERVQAG